MTETTTSDPDGQLPGDLPTIDPDPPSALPPAPIASTRHLAFGAAGIGIGLIAGILIGTIAGPLFTGIADAQTPSPIAGAVSTCDVEDNAWIVVGDGGDSISMQTKGEESGGADLVDVVCVLTELDVPDSVITRMSSTRALDGRQAAEWNNLSGSWGYHPDNGLDIVIESPTTDPHQNRIQVIRKATHMNARITITAAALLATLALAGCSQTGGTTTSRDEPAAVASEAPAAAQPDVAPFGGTFTYEDGIAVTVAAPAPYTPSQYAAGATHPNNVTITFTVVNGTAETLELLAFPEVTSGGVKGESITDLSNDSVALEPFGGNADVLPGQSFSWTMAYSLADLADVTVSISPSAFEHDAAIFSTVAG